MRPALTPPQNDEAELNVLGAMIQSAKAIETAGEIVRPSDFYKPSHGIIYKAIIQMHTRGEPVDPVTLPDYLQTQTLPNGKNALEEAGGTLKVRELIALSPTSSNVAHHARIVSEQAALRRLLSAGQNITRLAIERPGELDELVEAAEAELSRAVSITMSSATAPLADEIQTVWGEIEAAQENGGPVLGVSTGFVDLDHKLLGLHPGQLLLVAARPSMGKSAFAQNIAENIADHVGPVAFFSLEMTKREIVLRGIARAGRVDSQALVSGKLTDEEFAKARTGAAAIHSRAGKLLVNDTRTMSPTQIRTEVRKLVRQNGLKAVFIDYIQLMIPPTGGGRKDDNRAAEVSEISRALKVLAGELAVPIVALAQLNRNLEARQDKRPQLSDLRDSGSLEQDADVVLFLYRDDYYNPKSEKLGEAEVIVAKQRMGPTGSFSMTFNKRFNSFYDLAREES